MPPPAAPVADTSTLETLLGTANVCSDPVYWYVHVTMRPVCVQLVASPLADPVTATAQTIGSVTVVNPQRLQRNHLGTSGGDALTPGLGAQPDRYPAEPRGTIRSARRVISPARPSGPPSAVGDLVVRLVVIKPLLRLYKLCLYKRKLLIGADVTPSPLERC
jgi:hypothetical protein